MSEANKLARIEYWAKMTPEQKSARMRAIAKKKQKNLTFKQRRDHGLKMVAARRKKQIDKLAGLPK